MNDPKTASEAFEYWELAIEKKIEFLVNHTPPETDLIIELYERAANFFVGKPEHKGVVALMFRQAGETALDLNRYKKAKELFQKGLESEYVHPQDKEIMETGFNKIHSRKLLTSK